MRETYRGAACSSTGVGVLLDEVVAEAEQRQADAERALQALGRQRKPLLVELMQQLPVKRRRARRRQGSA